MPKNNFEDRIVFYSVFFLHFHFARVTSVKTIHACFDGYFVRIVDFSLKSNGTKWLAAAHVAKYFIKNNVIVLQTDLCLINHKREQIITNLFLVLRSFGEKRRKRDANLPAHFLTLDHVSRTLR